jgi:hypothetical protein
MIAVLAVAMCVGSSVAERSTFESVAGGHWPNDWTAVGAIVSVPAPPVYQALKTSSKESFTTRGPHRCRRNRAGRGIKPFCSPNWYDQRGERTTPSSAGPICTPSSISGTLSYVPAKRHTFLIEKNQSRGVSIDASAKLLGASFGGVGPCARVLLHRAVST